VANRFLTRCTHQYNVVGVLAIILTLSACSSMTTAYSNDNGYNAWMNKTVDKIKNKPDYRRIPINTTEQINHFDKLSHQLYKKAITKKIFIQEMNKKYPAYSKSIKWLAEQYPQ
jgi:PBP1b-binding outer membrane lipoprotein LpoB